MSRNDNRFQTVNILEFVGFRISRTGHTSQFFIHTEVILESDRGKRLVFLIDLDTFLSFNGLMQTFGPTATRHQTAREFVHDDDFTVLNHIVLITLKE